MVAKVDADELYYPLKRIIILTSLIAFFIILSFSVIIIQYWRNQHIGYLSQLNATKDKFFSIVSHDLRSPFASILGFAELLVDDINQNELGNARKYAEIIQDSSRNAVDLLGNLTEWSRLNTDRMVFKPKEIDIISVIEEVTELLSASAIQKSISIIKKSPEQVKVYADKDMIGSVLRNLISNSIKFSEPGGRIHVSVIQKFNEIIVEVLDFGTGIEKELRNKLFSIEENVSTPGTQNEKGTGLGLILVREFITTHGGRVSVESEVGQGSKFIFTLPVK
jgi:signal transduction histidine kinase